MRPSNSDREQQLELLMTLGQSLVGSMFLMNMRLEWWEARRCSALVHTVRVFAGASGARLLGHAGREIHGSVAAAYLVWAGIESPNLPGKRKLHAFELVRLHVAPAYKSPAAAGVQRLSALQPCFRPVTLRYRALK